jgi:hypothetical protein
MNVTKVYIQYDPDSRLSESFHVAYQNAASYITLSICEWLKIQKLCLDKFSRIGFEEVVDNKDLRVFESVKLFKINLVQDFQSLDQFSNAEVTHQYFKRKYIEGFKRFDAHFGLSLTSELETFLDDYFKNGYVYEKEMKSKRINGLKHQVLKQYKYDLFNLVLRVFHNSGALLKETILQNGKPDPFLVHYNVNKVNILNDKIQVLGSTGKVETEHVIESVLH